MPAISISDARDAAPLTENAAFERATNGINDMDKRNEFAKFEQDEALQFRDELQARSNRSLNDDSDDDDDVGPKPLMQSKELMDNKKVSYGGALLPGEGAAIAQFVQQNMRIPRRGEIGWKAEEIEGLEHQGYVMSGSRHQRMNAIRLRKENQVYSAEEKRALALISFEEKQQKENKVIGDFRKILNAKIRESGADVSSDGGNASS